MKKQELIEGIEAVPAHNTRTRPWIDKKIVLGLIRQLDEPEKVKVPQFVAEYIEESRLKGWDLLASMCFVLNAKNKKTTKWFYLGENKNIFALAWIFGYEVEKEPKYTVKIKGVYHGDLGYAINFEGYSFYCKERSLNGIRFTHTRKQLEEAGFGWVFDCEGIEIEEVGDD